MPKFEVIHGTPAPDTPVERVRKRLRKTDNGLVAQCPRCAGREMIEAKLGILLKNGRPTGGKKILLCATCHRKGERVVVT